MNLAIVASWLGHRDPGTCLSLTHSARVLDVCSLPGLAFYLNAVDLNLGPHSVYELLYSLSHAPHLWDPSTVLFCVKPVFAGGLRLCTLCLTAGVLSAEDCLSLLTSPRIVCFSCILPS